MISVDQQLRQMIENNQGWTIAFADKGRDMKSLKNQFNDLQNQLRQKQQQSSY